MSIIHKIREHQFNLSFFSRGYMLRKRNYNEKITQKDCYCASVMTDNLYHAMAGDMSEFLLGDQYHIPTKKASFVKPFWIFVWIIPCALLIKCKERTTGDPIKC